MSGGDFPIGPFTDYEENPILRPTEGFQSRRLYNPTAIKEGKIFYCQGVEPGPTPVILNEEIFLIYNGWGRDCIYKPAGVLFSREDPAKILGRTREPLLGLSRDYGAKFGEGNHCVAEGLVKHGSQWFLYYAARPTALPVWRPTVKGGR